MTLKNGKKNRAALPCGLAACWRRLSLANRSPTYVGLVFAVLTIALVLETANRPCVFLVVVVEGRALVTVGQVQVEGVVTIVHT